MAYSRFAALIYNLKGVVMEGRIEIGRMYETLLASPGMNQRVKLSLTICRKTALLLNQLIEIGLAAQGKTPDSGLIASMPQESFQEMEVISMELLRKADLTELNERLKTIDPK